MGSVSTDRMFSCMIPPRLYIPAPGCPDPRFRAVIMTNEWQKQPQKLEAMRPSTCVGLNRSSDGTDASPHLGSDTVSILPDAC